MDARQGDLDVVVIGGANTDYLIRGPSLPGPGCTVDGLQFQEAPGGKGANQAVAAARLGARVAFIGKVGADPRGQALLDGLRAEGVEIEGALTTPSASTGVALIMVDARGEKQIMTAPGANHQLGPEDVSRASALIARSRVALLQLELQQAAVEAAARLCRAAGATVILDPAPPRELPEELLRDVHVIRPNAAEAEVLTGIRVEDAASARRAAQNLLRRGVGAAVVGAPGGSLLLSADAELWLPLLDVEVLDATGAGDAFAAALAVWLGRGEGLARAARFANAAAALATTKLGARAGLPGREQVEQLERSTAILPREVVSRAR